MIQKTRSDFNPIISVVIVSYNVLDALQQCLGLLQPLHDLEQGEVWVIDNASNDASADWVEQQQWPHLVRNSENLGFSVAVNQGILKAHGQFILLLNPDTMASMRAIDGMLSFMTAHENCGISGVQLLHVDQSLQKSFHFFPTPWSYLAESLFLNRIKPIENIFEKPVSVDAVVGACMMIRRRAIESMGLFDEQFFLYSEEVDFCLRAHQVGWEVYLLPEIRVEHSLALSSKDNPGNAFVALYRSRILYVNKHFSFIGKKIAKIGFFTGVFLRVCLWSFVRLVARTLKLNKISHLKYAQNRAVLMWYMAGCPNPHDK